VRHHHHHHHTAPPPPPHSASHRAQRSSLRRCPRSVTGRLATLPPAPPRHRHRDDRDNCPRRAAVPSLRRRRHRRRRLSLSPTPLVARRVVGSNFSLSVAATHPSPLFNTIQDVTDFIPSPLAPFPFPRATALNQKTVERCSDSETFLFKFGIEPRNPDGTKYGAVKEVTRERAVVDEKCPKCNHKAGFTTVKINPASSIHCTFSQHYDLQDSLCLG